MTESEQPQHAQSEPAARPERRMVMQDKFPRALWVRLIIYVAVGHVFAFFVYLLFVLGGKNQ
ncbi:hypothetical protein GCM10012286_10380 [Streptomyces lasiicapitis]|uniref:Small hydrophobic protein n=1 Tax=Streptomyces lasiicapitis TaxID=1923961 RepID=A0ABQ2LL75_9ACTN|nr:hypothetical protein GCM10012286_10380 [Streptomyces lasiicapitis]